MERRTNLPVELSSFVGRRHELTQVRSALSEGRLVTLFGLGGVGKTRLALRAAADLTSQFPDGAWVVELAPVLDPDLVVPTVVAALGLRDAEAGPPLARLVAHLAHRELLLVLDNCEHVQEAVSPLVVELLARCPGVRIIATSRHELGVDGERLLAVPPLAVPAEGRPDSTPDGLLHYDAVRLFVDRATARWASFVVDEANQAAVAELVRRLDGVPLAIELASVRIRSLTVQQILDRLNDRFTLLTRGSRAALPRQQTLRALIDWSYDLLDPAERLVWQRCAVFSGSFDDWAAEAVCAGDGVLPGEVSVLLEGLVAKSILVRDTAGGEEPRYSMLESIKEYGLAQLDDGDDRAALVDRHRLHYLERVTVAAQEMYGPREIVWLRRLRADHDNLRAALVAGALDGSPEALEDARVMVGALLHYWVMGGRFSEGRRWCDRLLRDAAVPTPGRAATLVVAGRLAVLQGEADSGRELLSEAESTLAQLPEGPERSTWLGHALHGKALAEVFWGDPALAVSLLEEALRLHERGTDPFGVPLALIQLSTVHATLGDVELANDRAEQCMAMSTACGETWCAALARWTQALTMWRSQKPARARVYAREVLQLKEPFGDRMGMAMSMEVLAWVLATEEKYVEAARLLGAVDTALRSLGGALFGHLHEDHERCAEAARRALGDQAYDAAVAEGADLGFDEAVARALNLRRIRGVGGDESVRLTRREEEIASLVAEGLTNREIAERLFMSRRTAEGHVARILGKLGFTSRDQVSAWMADRRKSV